MEKKCKKQIKVNLNLKKKNVFCDFLFTINIFQSLFIYLLIYCVGKNAVARA